MLRSFIFLAILMTTLACHYSCATCVDQKYTSCRTCPADSSLTVLQDTSIVPPLYWASIYNTGSCAETMLNIGANALGVIIFLIVVGISLMLRTKQSFYLLITLQTYGLYNLIQIAWINPIGYILQALQYFMIFNTIGSGYKQADYVMMGTKNYRLDTFLKQTDIVQNIAIIAPFTIIALVLLIVICVITTCRKKQEKKQLQNEEQFIQKQGNIFANNRQIDGEKHNTNSLGDKHSRRDMLSDKTKRFSEKNRSQTKSNKAGIRQSSEMGSNRGQQPKEQNEQTFSCWKWITENALIPLAKLLLCIVFFMIQETILVLLANLVFIKPTSTPVIALSIIYLHMLVFFMSYSYYYRIDYFKDKKVLYINYAKKVILPILVVVPIKYQYLIFLFALVIIALEFIIDLYNGLYRQLNRLAVYKVSEILVTILLLIYYLIQKSQKGYEISRAAAIACIFFVGLTFACVVAQIPLAIKQKYFDKINQTDNSNQLLKNQQITLEDINPSNQGAQNMISNEEQQNLRRRRQQEQKQRRQREQRERRQREQRERRQRERRQRERRQREQRERRQLQQKQKRQRQQRERRQREKREKEQNERKLREQNDKQKRQREQRQRKQRQERQRREREQRQRKERQQRQRRQREQRQRRQQEERQRTQREQKQKQEKAENEEDNNKGLVVQNLQQEPELKEESPAKKKKRRKQIIDPQLRKRYGM